MDTELYIGIILSFIVGILIIKHLRGDYNYTDELIRQETVKQGVYVTYIYVTKRTYKNGRIKIIKKLIEI